ncbi:MAG: helix-hairpin-helix domain-containing protein [Prevotellaceae bacterium]|nr:helix-hairpin-helix domain-containing protein [Prevotellaceae bacterium]
MSVYDEEIALFLKAVDSEEIKTAEKEKAGLEFSVAERVFFHFDPNHASDKDWEKLGLNGRQIRNIRNYQAKGGKFRKREDLRKVYSLPATQYELLEPYILIRNDETTAGEAVESKEEKTLPETVEKKIIVIEINAADSVSLTQLPGIGPVLASRIIKYRNLTGGFVNPLQLSEVYGISAELTDNLKEHLSIDSAFIKKIPLNTAKFRDLFRHPYISEQQARGILYYVKLQGNVKNIGELVRNNILTAEDAEKLGPYLSFD